MAVANGYGKTVTSGSVFMYDVGDIINSYKGKPTTNFYTNGHFSGGTGISQEGGSNATNTIIQLPNPGNSPYVLQQTMGVAYTEYQINLTNQLQSNTTYVLSGWYAESADYVGASRMFHCRAFSTSGAHVALGTGIGTVLKTVEVGGLTWRFCYATITTPADYSNDFNWYVGYDGGSYTGARYYTNLMMEVGTTPSQFVDGTRSATQGLLPIVGNSSIDLSNVSFDSNAQVIWDGTDDTLAVSETYSHKPGLPYTYEIIVYPLGSDNAYDKMLLGKPGWHTGIMHQSGYTWFRTRYGSPAFYDAGWYSLSAGNYYHLVAVYIPGTSMRFYVNGVLNGENTSVPSSLLDIGDTLNIGGSSSNYSSYVKIPVAKVYNRALSLAEVKQNYNKYKSRFNLA